MARAAMRTGFTLFEVVISMLVLSIAVLTTLALLPIGLKAQQLSRYQIYASSMSLSLMENFHNPLPLFRGHGSLAPNLDANLELNNDLPPSPGWANRLRTANMTASPFQADIERYLCGTTTGVLPVPLEISRRFESSNDEIQKILDQGGELFYLDSAYIRGLTIGSSRDKSSTLTPAPEVQKLVFAVTGYAQQNALTQHPVESWPWYELYPFPPAWVALKAYGYELRRGPVTVGKWYNNATSSWVFNPSPFLPGHQLRGQAGDILWGDGGHSALSQDPDTGYICQRDPNTHQAFFGYKDRRGVVFADAPMNRRQYRPYKGPQGTDGEPPPYARGNNYTGDLQRDNLIDPPDKVGKGPGAIREASGESGLGGDTGWYQGRNWRYFKENFGAGTPWADGWLAFQRLAGFNDDDGRDKTWNQYATMAVTEDKRYDKAGWLPVFAMLTMDDEPKYDHYWWDVGNPNRYHGTDVGGDSIGSENQVGTGVWPPRPVNYTGGDWDSSPWSNGVPGQWDNKITVIGAPCSQALPPTYEMRASYRDKAIALWNAVSPSSASAAPTVGVNVYNTQVDCDQYEFSAKSLDTFPLVDPQTLSAPPHPAQVLALSYLAHAAMLMTGWDVPVQDPYTRFRADWDLLTWRYAWIPPAANATQYGPGNYQVPPAPTAGLKCSRAKDVKLLDPNPGGGAPSAGVVPNTDVYVGGLRNGTLYYHTGATQLCITNDTDRPMTFYDGDEICFEQDYREWYTTTRCDQPARGCIKYRIKIAADVLTIPASHGAPYADVPLPIGADTPAYHPPSSQFITIEPPLLHDYDTMVGIAAAMPYMAPPRVADPGHPQQIIRVCSEYDRAFARKVHEMCMLWAAAYGSENAYDWGAPRPMNHQVMSDKPLVLLDLFHDAKNGSVSPVPTAAVRTPTGLPTATTLSSTESFYRWMVPPNPAPRSWFRASGYAPAAGPVDAISHQGPGRHPEKAWTSMVFNPELAPPGKPGSGTTVAWDWSSDQQRYWLDRPFQPFHRGRQLVFWGIDWKSYEDAETAPTAPMDAAKIGRAITANYDNGSQVTGFLPTFDFDNWTSEIYSYQSDRADSLQCGNPETPYVWIDAARKTRYMDDATTMWDKHHQAYTREGPDALLGHFGADRNNNRILDIGPIPKTTRMRALTIARFNVYDPVMRLNVNN